MIAYRLAVLTSTGFTLYYLLFGREIRLFLEIIYRYSEKMQSNQKLVAEIREQRYRAYNSTRDRLHFTRQK